MSVAEQAYHDGFMDGQRHLVEIWDEVHEDALGRTEAYEEFRTKIEEIRKEVEIG